ncbi:MAG: mechanosensitive ion channel domain-containing protein [Nitrospirota bacterium]
MNEIAEYINISSSPIVNGALFILFFIIVAKIADLMVDKVLRKFTRFTKSDVDDRIIDLIHKPIFFTIIIIGLTFTIHYLTPSEKAVFYTRSFMNTLLTVIWCVTTIKISNTIIEHAVNKVADVTGLSRDIVPLVENVSKIIIIVASMMVVLSIWKINITPVLASAGIAGAAVAFAAKDTIANFFGGISVFVDKPFTIGDYIVLDQGERGEVVNIGVRSTRIKTRDDILITIPNSIIANTKIINESAPVPNFRVRIPVSVAYGSDIDHVQNTLLDLVKGNDNVLPDPAPRVRFRAFGDSSLNFELLCWAKEPALRGLTVHELNCAIYKKFGETGIKIPFPQRDVHMHQE